MSIATIAGPNLEHEVRSCPFCNTAHRPDQIVWLTAEEIADRFRTAPSSVRDWNRRGVGPKGSAVFGKRRLWPACAVDRWQAEQIEKNGR